MNNESVTFYQTVADPDGEPSVTFAGYAKIVEYPDEGVVEIVGVKTDNSETVLATRGPNHLGYSLEGHQGEWYPTFYPAPYGTP